MTEQLYRRRAGEPVKVWRVGDGEPPEWAEETAHGHAPRWGHYLVSNEWPPLTPKEFAHSFEPVPAPAEPDAGIVDLPDRVRDALANYDTGLWRTCSGCHESEDGYDLGHYPHSEIFGCKIGSGCGDCGGIGAVWDTTDYEDMARAMSEEPAPAPDAREALEIARAALRRISDACPDTCDMTVAHGMAAVADEAIVRIGSGWTPTHRHYKGGLYRELRRGVREADFEPVVIYESEDGWVFVRPTADFEAKMPDGTPRFARIGGGA